jgi:hypothetical protein
MPGKVELQRGAGLAPGRVRRGRRRPCTGKVPGVADPARAKRARGARRQPEVNAVAVVDVAA